MRWEIALTLEKMPTAGFPLIALGFLGGQSQFVVVCAATLKMLIINLLSPGEAAGGRTSIEAVPLR
jgi:hypothetical protein